MKPPTKSRTRRELDVDVYQAALQRCEYIMDTFDKVVVMFSGGKDSTATLQCMLAVAASHPRFARHLPMRVVHYDEEAIPYETEEYVRRIAQRDDVALEWYCLPVQHRNACSRHHPYWWPWAPEDRDKWCRPMPPEGLTTLPGFTSDPPDARPSIPDIMGLLAPGKAKTALVMGIRAQESITRHRAVTQKAIDNYIIAVDCPTSHGNVYKAYPVYDWQTTDIWTAPAQLGWDYNRAYDHMEMAGISAGVQRCSPAFGEEPLQKIHTYASCFPDVWAKMCERVPGIGAAHRYALTELYAYRDRPEKPHAMPWPEFIANYLEKFKPAESQFVAERIKKLIRAHYRKTTDPIAPKAAHPHTGISWDFLLTIAMRGDFKNRKQEGARVQAGREVHMWNKWATDIAGVLSCYTAVDSAAKAAIELGHPRPITADPHALIPDQYRTPGP